MLYSQSNILTKASDALVPIHIFMITIYKFNQLHYLANL